MEDRNFEEAMLCFWLGHSCICTDCLWRNARHCAHRSEVPKAGELPPVPPQQLQRKAQAEVDHDSAVAKAEAAANAAGSRGGSMHGEM